MMFWRVEARATENDGLGATCRKQKWCLLKEHSLPGGRRPCKVHQQSFETVSQGLRSASHPSAL